jgi:hypothetical protein
MATIEINGKVINKITGTGIGSCDIELWVLYNGSYANTGKTAGTRADGTFTITGSPL